MYLGCGSFPPGAHIFVSEQALYSTVPPMHCMLSKYMGSRLPREKRILLFQDSSSVGFQNKLLAGNFIETIDCWCSVGRCSLPKNYYQRSPRILARLHYNRRLEVLLWLICIMHIQRKAMRLRLCRSICCGIGRLRVDFLVCFEMLFFGLLHAIGF